MVLYGCVMEHQCYIDFVYNYCITLHRIHGTGMYNYCAVGTIICRYLCVDFYCMQRRAFRLFVGLKLFFILFNNHCCINGREFQIIFMDITIL